MQIKLKVLVSHAGDVISREYLFTSVYGREYDGLDRSVDVRISQLRKKLGGVSQTASCIKTVWGRGYLVPLDAFSHSDKLE